MDRIAPLILTLALDERAFAFFEAERRRSFPPERNLIPAHLTLFHKLPGAEAGRIAAALTELCRAQPPVLLEATGPRFLGRGVAITLTSPALEVLRRDLAGRWAEWLTAQDRQRFQPHVTIQNKVSPDEARRLHESLARAFQPFPVRGSGLLLWRYRGGPWDAAGSFPFAGP